MTLILAALAILLLGVCLGCCANTAARNAETRAARRRHPSAGGRS